MQSPQTYTSNTPLEGPRFSEGTDVYVCSNTDEDFYVKIPASMLHYLQLMAEKGKRVDEVEEENARLKEEKELSKAATYDLLMEKQRDKKRIVELEIEVGEMTEETDNKNAKDFGKFSYKEEGKWITINLSKRERTVILYGIMQAARGKRNGEPLKANLRRLIGNGNTVNKSLDYMRKGKSRPLTDAEKEHIRRFCKEEGLDTAYILDYIN